MHSILLNTEKNATLIVYIDEKKYIFLPDKMLISPPKTPKYLVTR